MSRSRKDDIVQRFKCPAKGCDNTFIHRAAVRITGVQCLGGANGVHRYPSGRTMPDDGLVWMEEVAPERGVRTVPRPTG